MAGHATEKRPKDQPTAEDQRKRQAADEARFNRPGPMRRSEDHAEHEQRFRCLHCGYRLMAETDFRCSECGDEHERYVLERWFWGKEENRFERVLWMVRAVAFLKLWVFGSGITRAATAASAAGVMWACWKAGEGKRDTVGWQYAVAGMIAAGLILVGNTLFGFGLGTASFVTLDIAAACLLLTAMLRDADRQELWREPAGSRTALGILFAAPLLGIVFAMFDSSTGVFGFSNSLGISGKLSGLFPDPIRFLIPRVASLAVWLFVWYWLAGLRRAMFARAQHE